MKLIPLQYEISPGRTVPVADNHAAICDDGYAVNVRLTDNSTAGFPHMTRVEPYKTAMEEALAWCIPRATSFEIIETGSPAWMDILSTPPPKKE